MMLVEDLVILLEANRTANGKYYSLLDTRSKDVKSTVAEILSSSGIPVEKIKESLKGLNH